jgi:putative transposase
LAMTQPLSSVGLQVLVAPFEGIPVAPQLDVMVLDETGKPARPWLTVILDDHSRAVAGYTVFLGDPTALQTALALRQAVWRKADPGWTVCGLPAALYSDHGAAR